MTARAFDVGLIMTNEFETIYASRDDVSFDVKYRSSCHCRAVQYEVCADPVDSKICHCRVCQTLHAAPMQWAAIFHKHHVRFSRGLTHLNFYNSELNKEERILPCKVSCAMCGTPIADEGRRMWLAFPTLFNFSARLQVTEAFKPTCHIFYGMRMIDMNDVLPKWSGHKNVSTLL